MTSRRFITLAFVFAALLAALAAGSWWMRGSTGPRYEGANVLLISIDTLRADHLGAYGYATAETPRLDRLAREGILFEQVVSPLPLTLPAHTSLMTALPTSVHGVRDNDAFELAPETAILAEEMSTAGYDTAAFVGSFVLHARWGLNRGFSHYDDAFNYGDQSSVLGQVERPAEAVIDATLGWIEQPRDVPFFAWVHVYDPHSPYEAPEPYRSRYATRPYDGEIAYTDAQIGRLLDRLETAGLLDDTIVVVTADHGEGLGEHGEPGHGMFLYDTTLLVPLIVRLPDRRIEARQVTEQIRLIDVAPTILDLAGLEPPAGFEGETLTPFLVGESAARPAYSETFYPRWHFGWQELHALRKDGFKYILAPRPELFDVRLDPAENTNLTTDAPDHAAQLRAEVEDLRDAGATAARGQLGGDATEQLRALGYIGSAPADLPEGPLPDPKDKIHLFTKVSTAQGLMVAGQFVEATRLLREALDEDPAIVSAQLTLGNTLFRQADYAGAAQAYESALSLNPDEDLALLNLGLAHRRMGDNATAQLDFETVIALDPGSASAHFNLGAMALEAGDPRTARDHFQAAIDANDQLAGPLFGLGVSAFQLGDIEGAQAEFDRVDTLVDFFPELSYHRALIAETEGDAATAADYYRAELELNPRHYRSRLNLSQIHAARSDHAAAVEALDAAIEAQPELSPAHILLARSLLALEDPSRYGDIEDAARRGLALGPPADLRPLAHYVLADIYNRLGQPAAAQRELALAREAERAIGR